MRDFFKTKLRELEISLDEKQIDMFFDFKTFLLEYNKKVNLTSITEDKEVITKHFIDSLSCFKTGLIKGKVIDVGSGAGFPGLMLKFAQDDLDVTLVDSLRKRIDFLNLASNGSVKCIHARAEELAHNIEHREVYDIAVARAVAPLHILVELCAGFVKVGGYFIAMKGKEIEECGFSQFGCRLEDIFKLQIEDFTRNLMVIKKITQTSSKFPRKPHKIR